MQLATQCQSKGIGPATCGMDFITCDPETGTHGACIKFSTGAIVVAHFNGFGQALSRVLACAGQRGLFGGSVVVNVPCAPIQCGLNGNDFVIVAKAHERCVVHFGGIDHAIGAEQVQRVQFMFDLGEGLLDAWPKLPLNPFASAQTVAMFAAVGPFELPDKCTGLFGNGAHFDCAITAHVQNRSDVQCAYRCMGIPSAFGAVLLKDLCEGIGVLSQVFQGHGAVFNEAHRFAIALQTHHDVEACLANLPQILLRRIVNHFHHAVGQAHVAHECHQLLQFAF